MGHDHHQRAASRRGLWHRFSDVPTALQADALKKNGLATDALAAIQRVNATRLIPRLSA
jgi:hypothetical protein